MASDAEDPDRGPSTPQDDGPIVVGIGASAGGLSALKSFFQEIPNDSGLSFVVVVHLSPRHESHLAEVLQPHVGMPVQQVTETTPLLANHVHVIPPNAHLSAIDTHLRLSPLDGGKRRRAPIDHFFRTLARHHDGRAIGIVLTGTGSDGTLGLKDIKQEGGLTIVQDPEDAEYDGMPRSAIETGLIDLVLPLEEIPEAVLSFSRTRPVVDIADMEEDRADHVSRKVLQRIFTHIHARTGRDFSRYKRSTLLRRIRRRMQLNRVEELGDYLERLRDDSAEVLALADDLLITVTHFFRDPQAFDHLKESLLGLLAEHDSGDALRIWTVGCATGEEAYSLTMLAVEAVAESTQAMRRVQVFASDLHEASLERAREGFYPGSIDTDIRPDRLKRFFVKEGNGYRVRRELRELVVFAPHNLLSDPPFSQLDLIVCRNVLIYLQRDVQQNVIELFHYALRPQGLLLLGSAETVQGTDLFQTLDKKHRLYRKRNVPSREPRLPVFPLVPLRQGRPRARESPGSSPIAFGAMHQRMIERFGPPSLLVTSDDRVVHLSEHAGRYLVHPGGDFTSSVFRLVREELRVELRATIRATREDGLPRRSLPVAVQFNGTARPVVIDVRPSLDPSHDGFVLVLFDERDPGEAQKEGLSGPSDALLDAQARELQAEADLARQRLQTVIEEYETSQEEMRASNEELQSTNEELRSTLEELEASKEELQSINEELETVNQENRHKVEELAQLSGDLQNLLVSTDIATIFLDRDMRILRFTPGVNEIFNVQAADRGRRLSDLTHRLGSEDLVGDAQLVLQRLVPIEREIEDDHGRWFITRVLPYRSSEDRIEGVVITFVDITRIKEAEREAQRARSDAETIIETLHEPLLVLDADLRVQSANPAFFACFRLAPSDTIGRLVYELGQGEWGGSELRAPLESVLHQDQVFDDLIVQKHFQGIGERTVSLNARRLANRDRVLVGIRDVTEIVCSEASVLAHATELEEQERRKDRFLAMLGHELRNPLAALDSSMNIIQRGLRSAKDVHPAMVNHIGQLTRLVNDLLDIARVTRGKIDLQRSRTDLVAVVRAAMQTVESEMNGREQQISVSAPPALLVDGDEARLEQVMSNLLSNASKYSPQGGHVEVRLERDGDDAVLRVRDQGRGLRPDELDTIFEAFVQGEDDSQGLGIGLSLARTLVELHGGSVDAQSEGPGQGSTFTVRIPVGDVDGARERSSFDASATAPLPWPARVLIADDLRDSAESLALLLRTSGAETRCAYDGSSALAAARDWHPDVALIDIGLPEMTGLEVAHALRHTADGADMLLVAVTGYGDAATEERVQRAGFDARLLKPVDHAKLRALLLEHHERRQRDSATATEGS